ncbi:MAG: hypothetical protein ACRD0P_06670 [Stackebrandtia sp.]
MTPPTRLARLAAMRAGGYAARHGHPLSVCPFNANGSPDERVLALAFARAYLRHADAGRIDYDT